MRMSASFKMRSLLAVLVVICALGAFAQAEPAPRNPLIDTIEATAREDASSDRPATVSELALLFDGLDEVHTMRGTRW